MLEKQLYCLLLSRGHISVNDSMPEEIYRWQVVTDRVEISGLIDDVTVGDE